MNDIFSIIYDKYKIDKPIRLIELFGGIGAQAKALENIKANFETYKYCDFDKFACVSYNAIHNTNFAPSDITKISGKDLEIVDKDKYVYIMTYSFPCGLRGEKIKVENGYKNIEDVELGDYVLTHTNTYKKVVKTMTRKTQGYYKIKYLGGESLLTSEHPLYVYRDSKFQWVKVKDLKLTDRVSFNVNDKETDVELSNEYLWLLGRYVADGWVNKYLYNSVEFAIGNKKEEEFLNNIPQEFRDRFKKFQKSCLEYRIADKELQEYCLQFGQGAKNKKIPEWVLNLPKNKLQSFFDGYISGDGHTRFKGKSKEIMFATTSFELFLGIQSIIAKLYSRICSMYVRKDNRKITFNDTYNCQVVLSSNSICQETIGDKIVTRVNKIEYIDELVDVFNFEVEKDNSYTVNNIIVHNCQDLSVAGKRKGMSKETQTRSSLLWEVERILNELKELNQLPQILLMENVPEVIGKRNIKDFEKWYHFLANLGYSSYYKVLNAKDFGIPQNRKRCFMISFLGNYSYQFPENIPLKLKLKDMLEKNVDEKFYLSPKKVHSIANWKAQQNPLKDIDKDKTISPTLTARGAGEEHSGMVLINENVENNEVPAIDTNTQLKVVEKSSLIKENNKNAKHQQDLLQSEDGICRTIPAGTHGSTPHLLKTVVKSEPEIINPLNEITRAVKAGCGSDSMAKVIKVGSCMPSGYSSDTIVSKDGIAPTVMDNHGAVTTIKDEYLGTYNYNESDKFIGNRTRESFSKEYISTIRTNHSEGVIIGSTQKHASIKEDGVSPSLTSAMGMGGGQVPMHNYDLRIRKLTPKECYRLMGFTDEDFIKAKQSLNNTFYKGKDKSDAQLYKQAGNSIVVQVLMAIFKQLF